MKRDLSQKVLTVKGAEFEPSLTLEMVCFTATTNAHPEDQSMPIEGKLKLHKLAKKVAQGAVVEFDADELAMLRDRIGKMFIPHVVGQACELLDADYSEPLPPGLLESTLDTGKKW